MNPVSPPFRITSWNGSNFIGHLVNAPCLLYFVFFSSQYWVFRFDLLNSRFGIFVHMKKNAG